jgi:hypothetical protein
MSSKDYLSQNEILELIQDVEIEAQPNSYVGSSIEEIFNQLEKEQSFQLHRNSNNLHPFQGKSDNFVKAYIYACLIFSELVELNYSHLNHESFQNFLDSIRSNIDVWIDKNTKKTKIGRPTLEKMRQLCSFLREYGLIYQYIYDLVHIYSQDFFKKDLTAIKYLSQIAKYSGLDENGLKKTLGNEVSLSYVHPITLKRGTFDTLAEYHERLQKFKTLFIGKCLLLESLYDVDKEEFIVKMNWDSITEYFPDLLANKQYFLKIDSEFARNLFFNSNVYPVFIKTQQLNEEDNSSTIGLHVQKLFIYYQGEEVLICERHLEMNNTSGSGLAGYGIDLIWEDETV